MTLLILAAMFAFIPQETKAEEYEPLFLGLYLIQGDNLEVSQVDITVVVNDRETSTVKATYEVTNTGEENTSVYMAMPVSGKTITETTYRFSPYLYNSVLVSGDRINGQIQGVAVDYEMWRAFSFAVSLQAGETKTASVSYKVNNGAVENGRLNLSVDLSHLESWLDEPESVHVGVSFDARTVKPYNFDGAFSPEPTEMSDSYILSWDFGEGESLETIRFSYSFIDDVIKDELNGQGKSLLSNFVTAYSNRDYETALELGKEYVQSSENARIQSLTYLLMADCYLALGNYDQTMAVYELLGASGTDFGELDGPIQKKILLNRLVCLEKNKDYEMLYDTIVYEQTNPDQNYYIQTILEDTYLRIPEEVLEQLVEDRKPPSRLESMLNRFLAGEYAKVMIGAFALVMVVVVIILFIRRKRKKQNFFY